jgi:hypothetical protein
MSRQRRAGRNAADSSTTPHTPRPRPTCVAQRVINGPLCVTPLGRRTCVGVRPLDRSNGAPQQPNPPLQASCRRRRHPYTARRPRRTTAPRGDRVALRRRAETAWRVRAETARRRGDRVALRRRAETARRRRAETALRRRAETARHYGAARRDRAARPARAASPSGSSGCRSRRLGSPATSAAGRPSPAYGGSASGRGRRRCGAPR